MAPEISNAAQQIIVIHPGSLYLRMGKASDNNPVQILNCIARKRKPNGCIYSDPLLPKMAEKTKDLVKEIENTRLQISHTLQSCLQSDGKRRSAVGYQQISAFNRRSMPDIVEGLAQEKWYRPRQEVLVGQEVMELSETSEYNVHFPVRRGELNLHKNIGGGLMSVLIDIQTIWEFVIKYRLHIKLSDLHQYKAVLVVPNIYNRSHLKELTTILLTHLGFGSCFLVQDHVAACFGAGLGYACVVDVGDQKTSISCVEDGLSIESSRVCLKYGGADVTQTFSWLLQKCAFPYKECSSKKPKDALLLMELKELYCHVDMDICGSSEKSFIINRPDQAPVRYTLQLGDERLVTPLSLFNTELLKLTLVNSNSSKMIQVQKSSVSDPEDCFDAEYLRESGTRRGINITQAENNLSQVDSSQLMENVDDDIVVDSLDSNIISSNFANDFQTQDGQMPSGLDQAILQSIAHCTNDEVKRKMYSCILVVGGSIKFSGIKKWLQNRLALQIPYNFRGADQLDFVNSPKDMDAANVTWKGSAVMSCLESSGELWITMEEYQRYGIKVLREKVPFIW